MDNQTERSKKLYYLEYTDSALLYLAEPFQLVGFECKGNGWMPKYPNRPIEHIWPEFETWQPDVIFWRSRIMYRPDLAEEPAEWLTFCQRLRDHPTLRHTKVMAVFSGFYKTISHLETEWHQRYDFYDRGPLRVTKHPKIAKQLVGQVIKGFEGVNDYLLKKNGVWRISDDTEGEANRDELQPDAEGQFAQSPLTQLLTMNNQGQLVWLKEGIQAEQQTYIVYIVKNPSAWQEGLDQTQLEWLTKLANQTTSNYQLLIGVNNALLQVKPNIINQILKQVQDSGGWQVFINEHLWFERFCVSRSPENIKETFERIVYQGIETVAERWDFVAI